MNRASHPRHRATHALRLLAAGLVLAAACTVWAALPPIQVEIIGNSRVRATTQTVSGAAADTEQLLGEWREGHDFHYVVLNVPSTGRIGIELGFAEHACTGPGQRVFNVDVNERNALADFDVFALADGAHRAHVQKFSITPRRGFLDFHFTARRGEAFVSYIRLQGAGIDLLIGAEPPEDVTGIPRAQWNPETAEILMDEHHCAWPSGVPLGGIGTGKFEILANGEFANLTINNSWDYPVHRVPGTFIAVAAKATSHGGTGRILRVREPDTPLPEYQDARTMPSCTHIGLYPFANWSYDDPKLALRARVSAFSPMIPQNERDSSLPAAVIEVDIENPNPFPVAGAAALSWQDINGRGGSRETTDRQAPATMLVHTDAATSGVSGVRMASDETPAGSRATHLGEYFIGVETRGVVVTRCLHWNPMERLIPWWKQFQTTMRLQPRDKTMGVWRSGAHAAPTAVVVCAGFNMAPRERRTIPFVVTWHMPSVVMKQGDRLAVETNDYATSFASAVGVAGYVAAHRARLHRQTAEWHDHVVDSNLPDWLKVKLLNSAYPLTANTVLLDGGRYSMLESPQDMNGALGAIDRRVGVESLVSAFFPSLNRSELEMFGSAQLDDGRIPRLAGNVREAFGTGAVPGGTTAWPDVACAWVAQVVRHHRTTGDAAFLQRVYTRVLRAMEWLGQADRDGDGIPEGGTTFDYEPAMPGAMTYTATMYLAALRAAEAAATAMGDTDAATTMALRRARAEATLLQTLWSGTHFVKQHDPATDSTTSNSFAACLAGDWVARHCGLPSVMPDDVAVTAVRSIIRDHVEPFRPVPPMEVAADGTATGRDCWLPLLEPYVAGPAFRHGEPDAGLALLRRVYETVYDANRNPWNQRLNYYSPDGRRGGLRSSIAAAATWSAMDAITGFSIDLPSSTLCFNPNIPAAMNGELHVPVFCPAFWGQIDYRADESTGTLTIVKVFPAHGSQTIRRVVRGFDHSGTAVGERNIDPPFQIGENAVLPLH